MVMKSSYKKSQQIKLNVFTAATSPFAFFLKAYQERAQIAIQVLVLFECFFMIRSI